MPRISQFRVLFINILYKYIRLILIIYYFRENVYNPGAQSVIMKY